MQTGEERNMPHIDGFPGHCDLYGLCSWTLLGCRMGLWGEGLSFATFAEFHESMSKRGLGALEVSFAQKHM